MDAERKLPRSGYFVHYQSAFDQHRIQTLIAGIFPRRAGFGGEVFSPSNTRAEMDARLKDFFASGTQLAWIIHPDHQYVEVCHSPIARKMPRTGASLDGEHLLPGFQYPIADLFKEWDWD